MMRSPKMMEPLPFVFETCNRRVFLQMGGRYGSMDEYIIDDTLLSGGRS